MATFGQIKNPDVKVFVSHKQELCYSLLLTILKIELEKALPFELLEDAMKLPTQFTIQSLKDWFLSRGLCLTLGFAFGLAGSNPTLAQLAQVDDDVTEEPLVVRMYDVKDLVTRNGDYPFQGFILPAVSNQTSIPGPAPSNLRSSSSGGGGFGGGGGGGGGGVFRVPPVSPKPTQFGGPGQRGGGLGGGGLGGGGGPRLKDAVYELTAAIIETVAIDEWYENGGMGTITNLGEILIVSQTPTIHKQIDAFLNLLRATRKTNETPITIKTIWLTIDEAQLDSLKVTKNQAVDLAALKALAKDHGWRGQITCFDGQTVHIAAGNLKSSIESVIPVVGQIEFETELSRAIVTNDASQKAIIGDDRPAIPKQVMAQVMEAGLPAAPATQAGGALGLTNSRVGYTPVLRWINFGAVVQMTPKIESDSQRICLDLTSIFTVPNGISNRATLISGSADVDRLDFRSQQFHTSVRLKDSTPTLVGGSAIEGDIAGAQQTYLIVEAILGDK